MHKYRLSYHKNLQIVQAPPIPTIVHVIIASGLQNPRSVRVPLFDASSWVGERRRGSEGESESERGRGREGERESE